MRCNVRCGAATCACTPNIARACRLATERQNEQLRAWLADLRCERRRLEDRLLCGSASAAQDTRAGLEEAVEGMSASKAVLEADLQSLAADAADAHSLHVCFSRRSYLQ